jgi:hypothetical protein
MRGRRRAQNGVASARHIAVRRTASLPLAYGPRIRLLSELMDCRVKPGNDDALRQEFRSSTGVLNYA